MISGVYAPCTGFPFFRCGPLSSSTASRVEIPPEFLQLTVPDASCVLLFWLCSNHFSTSLLSKQFFHPQSRSFPWSFVPPPGRHECSRQPLTRKSSRSIITNVNATIFQRLGRSRGQECWRRGVPTYHFRRKTKRKRTLLSQTSFYFPKHCPCAAWILPNALAHGMVRRLAMQVNILGGFVLFFTFSQVVR